MEGKNEDTIGFAFPESNPHIIKVIGVGGGGGNAVNHMYQTGIHDVGFVVCNTDRQALDDSPVQYKVQLGSEGLGAGNIPEKARVAAEESIEAIDKMLSDGTKMVFITAGMGGGTGTGAAPIIAREAKSKNILTVGIVTIPFVFEGEKKIDTALNGVEEISKNVDALLVVNNERLRQIYPTKNIIEAFGHADDTLTIAARSIAEIITTHGQINLDFNDVCTVLRDGGVAIMSTGVGEGESRVKSAIEDALNSPLLNNNDIFDAKKILLYIYCSNKEDETMTVEEIDEVDEFMKKFGSKYEIKWGLAYDPELAKKIKITVLASGFGLSNVPGFDECNTKIGRIVDDEEEELKRKRRESAYGTRFIGKKPYSQANKIFIFNDVNIDNDDIIALVEQTPTKSRTTQTLRHINEKDQRDNYSDNEQSDNEQSDNEQQNNPATINFVKP